MGGGFTFGVPSAQHLDFSGPGGPALATSKLAETFLKQLYGLRYDHNYYLFLVTALIYHYEPFIVQTLWLRVLTSVRQDYCSLQLCDYCCTKRLNTVRRTLTSQECSYPCLFPLSLTLSLTLPCLAPPSTPAASPTLPTSLTPMLHLPASLPSPPHPPLYLVPKVMLPVQGTMSCFKKLSGVLRNKAVAKWTSILAPLLQLPRCSMRVRLWLNAILGSEAS